jgi:hypothetical protein
MGWLNGNDRTARASVLAPAQAQPVHAGMHLSGTGARTDARRQAPNCWSRQARTVLTCNRWSRFLYSLRCRRGR